jgi:hypothetical protein
MCLFKNRGFSFLLLFPVPTRYMRYMRYIGVTNALVTRYSRVTLRVRLRSLTLADAVGGAAAARHQFRALRSSVIKNLEVFRFPPHGVALRAAAHRWRALGGHFGGRYCPAGAARTVAQRSTCAAKAPSWATLRGSAGAALGEWRCARGSGCRNRRVWNRGSGA